MLFVPEKSFISMPVLSYMNELYIYTIKAYFNVAS